MPNEFSGLGVGYCNVPLSVDGAAKIKVKSFRTSSSQTYGYLADFTLIGMPQTMSYVSGKHTLVRDDKPSLGTSSLSASLLVQLVDWCFVQVWSDAVERPATLFTDCVPARFNKALLANKARVDLDSNHQEGRTCRTMIHL